MYMFLVPLVVATSLWIGVGSGWASPITDKIDALKRFSQVVDIVQRYYVRDVPLSDLINGALKGMLQELDPHSTVFTETEFQEMQETTSGEFFGIGIEITSENNQLTVVTPIEDTPAYKAGLQPGDIILSVNGKSTLEMSLTEAVSNIRGPKGTDVELSILRLNTKQPFTVQIKRDTIPLISVKARELEPGYYWVRVTRFSERTTDELHEALENALEESDNNIKGIVLDLRNNPGGLLDQAVSVADTFLQEGTIVSMRGRTEESVREFKAAKQKTDLMIPIVVLVNAGSASASEIVAGALGDHSRALLVGEPTFGKGSVQNVIPLSDKSGLKLTVALYYTPSGRSIQAEGIVPDLEIPFDLPDEDDMPILVTREKDLNKHLENTVQASPNPQDKKDDDIQKQLTLDNQLRMGLQLVKTLPRMREIN